LVLAEGLEYDFAPDDTPLVAHRSWAIVTAQLVDELDGTPAEPDGRPIQAPFEVEVRRAGAPFERAQDGSLARRAERELSVKIGEQGTFALVGRPWLRFPPLAGAGQLTVAVRARGFEPLERRFTIIYDTRSVAAPAPAVGDRTLTLDSVAGLVAGQTLLFGPAATPQYVRIRSVDAGNQLTLTQPLQQAQLLGAPVFPDAFVPAPPARVALRRPPVRLLGRVVRRNTATNVSAPIANAAIQVTDFWRTRARLMLDPAHGSMTDPTPAARQFAVSVAPGALAARAAGGVVGAITLPVGDERRLERPVSAGDGRVEVDRRQLLAPSPALFASRLLRLDPDEPELAEYQTIDTIDPVGGVDEPAELVLELPLRRAHAEGTRVARIDAPAPLPATPRVLRDAAGPGDRCLFLDALTGLGGPGALRLAGGGAPDEFQSFTPLAARSDARGYFRLPPVQRVARLTLRVDDGAGHVQTLEVDPGYGEAEHRLDVVYPA
jgi:hypothetical protein